LIYSAILLPTPLCCSAPVPFPALLSGSAAEEDMDAKLGLCLTDAEEYPLRSVEAPRAEPDFRRLAASSVDIGPCVGIERACGFGVVVRTKSLAAWRGT